MTANAGSPGPRPVLAGTINLGPVGRGVSVQGRAGVYADADAVVTVGLSGEDAAQFAVVRVDTYDVDVAPDGPPGRPRVMTLVPALSVDGPGPVDVLGGQAVMVQVSFTCPDHPTQTSYAAVASLAPLAHGIPVRAGVDIGTVDLACTQSPPVMQPGDSAAFTFSATSSLDGPVTVELYIDQVEQPQFTLQAPTFVTIPDPLGSMTVAWTAMVTCEASSSPGAYRVPFVLRASDHTREFGRLQVAVSVPRLGEEVTCDLPNPVVLDPGAHTAGLLHVAMGGGPARFSASMSSAAGFLTGDFGIGASQVDTTVDGQAAFPVRVQVSPQAVRGDRGSLRIWWAVDGDTLGRHLDLDVAVDFAPALVLAATSSTGDIVWASTQAPDNPANVPAATATGLTGVDPSMTIGDGQLIMVFHHPQLGPCLAGGDSHTLTMRGPLPAAGNGLAAAWYHGGLLLVGIAPGSSNLWWGTCQDLTFPRLIENHVLTDRATACAPALVIWHDLPVMAWRGVGQDQTIWWATFTDGAWSAQQQLTDRGTAASPALVVLHDVLYMIWRGVIDLKDGRADDDTLWYSTLDPGATPTWSPQAHMGGPNGDIQSVGSPAVAAFGPHLQIATYTAAQPSGSGGGGGSDGGSGSGGGSGSDGNGGSGGATGAPQTSDAPADAAPTLAVFDGTTVISSTTLAHTLGHDGLTAFA